MPELQQFALQAGAQFAIEHAHVRDHAFESVEIGIEPQRLQGTFAGRFRRRNALDDRFENFFDADAFLGAGGNRRIGGDGQNVFELLLGERDIRVRQIDLVDDRDDREVLPSSRDGRSPRSALRHPARHR